MPIQGFGSCRRVHRQIAAEQGFRVEVSEHQVGVGDRRLVAAEPVAHRPRVGAGAAGANPRDAAGINPGEAAAPGADFRNVDGRDADQMTTALD